MVLAASAQDTRSSEVRQPAPRYQAYKKQKKGLFSFLKKKNKEPKLKSLEEEKLAFRKRVSEAYWENEKVNYKTQKVKKKEAKKGKKFHGDRKSTRLNSSHQIISYAVFCLKKNTPPPPPPPRVPPYDDLH